MYYSDLKYLGFDPALLWTLSLCLQLSEVPFRRDLGGKVFGAHRGNKRGTKEGPLSRPITRGLLNKVVKLMWDEIRMGERGVP